MLKTPISLPEADVRDMVYSGDAFASLDGARGGRIST